MLDTKPLLAKTQFPSLSRGELTTLQVNLGYTCNQSCVHCHVNAGPKRTEQMSRENIDILLNTLRVAGIKQLDLTGGAPEMNPHFRYLVREARTLGVQVIDRCNLTILSEPGQEDLAEFLAEHQVEVVASLPCYQPENVEKQRGKGVFQLSIDGLKKLNQLGYGKEGYGKKSYGKEGSNGEPELVLNLMYNPDGPNLPPSQQALQQQYTQVLWDEHQIVFNNLYTLTNMPIMRFGSMLISKGQFDSYMQTLKQAYQVDNLQTVMCLSLISIDWQGYLYDCDFNQMLNIPTQYSDHDIAPNKRLHLKDLSLTSLRNSPIQVADHCYGCTAGAGSSCGGALS